LTLKSHAQFPPVSNNNPFLNNENNQQTTPRDFGNPFANSNNRDRETPPFRDPFGGFPNNNNFQPTSRPGGFNDPYFGRRDPFGGNGNSFGTAPRYDFTDPGFTGSSEEKKCPKGWDRFRETCYRFAESPTTTRNEAQLNCKVAF